MLEQLRQKSSSFIMWILFIIIIAAFVLTFGTQSEVNLSGCGGTRSDFVMVVDDEDVSVHSWRFANSMTRGGGDKKQRGQFVLDWLFEREILAQAAREAGFNVTTDMAAAMIRDGQFMVFGTPSDGKPIYFVDGYFDYDRLKMFVESTRVPSVDQFIIEQQRELEAAMMQALLMRGVVASPEEARARYVYESSRATIELVQLRASEYQRKITLSPADVDRFRQGHDSEVRAKYETDKALYNGRGKEVKIRQIFISRKQPVVVTPGSEEAEAAEAAQEDTDPGLLAARAARDRIQAGADFAQVAAEISEDERSKARGGNLGWRSQENPGLGAPELAAAVKTLDAGALSEVITVARGYYILQVEEAREGDLSYEQVAHEIAEQMAMQTYAKAAARRDAQRALERARAGLAEGKRLPELFEVRQPPPSGFENLPAEIQEQLRLQMEQQGSITFDGPDRPAEASWQDGAQPGVPGDQPGPAPAAQPGAAQPAAGGAATTAVTVAADDVPVPLDLVSPQVQRMGPLTRDPDGMILGVGKSDELMSAIFTELDDGELTGQLYEVNDSFVFVQLVSREEPNLETFQQDELDRTQRLGRERGNRELQTWLQARCQTLVEGRTVGINRELVNQLVTEREGEEFNYQPNCAGM